MWRAFAFPRSVDPRHEGWSGFAMALSGLGELGKSRSGPFGEPGHGLYSRAPSPSGGRPYLAVIPVGHARQTAPASFPKGDVAFRARARFHMRRPLAASACPFERAKRARPRISAQPFAQFLCCAASPRGRSPASDAGTPRRRGISAVSRLTVLVHAADPAAPLGDEARPLCGGPEGVGIDFFGE